MWMGLRRHAILTTILPMPYPRLYGPCAAREIGADEGSDAFDRIVERMARTKAKPEGGKPATKRRGAGRRCQS
jgi:hypothetical protein